jgi:DNA-nicking Smr family endonuclease
MPLSDKDREIWRMAMQGVKPITHDQVHQTSLITFKSKPTPELSHTWDLHGMTLMDAHAKVNRVIDGSHDSFKYMTFITGKSGQMQKEFPDWLRTHPHVHRVDVTTDGGAYKVWFKKTRHKKE